MGFIIDTLCPAFGSGAGLVPGWEADDGCAAVAATCDRFPKEYVTRIEHAPADRWPVRSVASSSEGTTRPARSAAAYMSACEYRRRNHGWSSKASGRQLATSPTGSD